MTVSISTNDREIQATFHVINKKADTLLGRHLAEELGLVYFVKRVRTFQVDELLGQFPELFTGLRDCTAANPEDRKADHPAPTLWDGSGIRARIEDPADFLSRHPPKQEDLQRKPRPTEEHLHTLAAQKP
ncbi:hypothetical protein NDU88_007712 [Pleurodeles waltl]|uniref:Uncharacterized protein n=1 Tax=Pleurodeles waltl TaxID=8319 RepID=A0AAV7U0J8_PLEWA|nr:hypothetical protein NDU88_007712 [Pleurodeles waltl]